MEVEKTNKLSSSQLAKKRYAMRNKEEINAKQREELHCEICDCPIKRGAMYNHRKKSNTHLLNLQVKELKRELDELKKKI